MRGPWPVEVKVLASQLTYFVQALIVTLSCVRCTVVPLQWLYDVDKLKGIVGDKDPVFWPESHSPFFKLPLGRNSCYGDYVRVTLKSLVDKKGASRIVCV